MKKNNYGTVLAPLNAEDPLTARVSKNSTKTQLPASTQQITKYQDNQNSISQTAVTNSAYNT